VRAIICGPRDFTDAKALEALIESCPWKLAIETVMSGACRLDESHGNTIPPYAQGADGIGERYAHERFIPVERYYAKWRALGRGGYDRGAGPKRNRLMAELANSLIAIPDSPPYPHSGTWNMLCEGVRFGLEIWVPEKYRATLAFIEAYALEHPSVSAPKLLDAAIAAHGRTGVLA
jgi:hypothetical protein